MFISRKERTILMMVYKYWHDTHSLATWLRQDFNAYPDINEYEVHEKFGHNGFNLDALHLLWMALNLKKRLHHSEKKLEREEKEYSNSINRLIADSYIEIQNHQVVATAKGVMAATDNSWLGTILRENKAWMLPLVIAIITVIVSIIGLLIKKCAE